MGLGPCMETVKRGSREGFMILFGNVLQEEDLLILICYTTWRFIPFKEKYKLQRVFILKVNDALKIILMRLITCFTPIPGPGPA